jgi:hypothetical protein
VTARRDREGKRALFEAPPIEVDDTLKDDPIVERHHTDGQEALYSAGPREPGTAVIVCSSCGVRSRITIIETLVRILAISLWIPMRPSYNRLIPCPSCQQRTWCRVEWTG